MSELRYEMVAIESGSGVFNGVLVRSAPEAPKVLLLHAWWGLTPFFQELALRLAQEGFTVFAPDLYDGKSAETIQQAEALEQNTSAARLNDIAASSVRWMQQQPSRNTGLGLVGFSLGGAWSLTLAAEFPEEVKAVVLYYASAETDYARVRARIQGHFGGLDEYTPQSDIDYMVNEMRTNGTRFEFFLYPEASHWFCETNRPEYRSEDAALVWQRAIKFLWEELKG